MPLVKINRFQRTPGERKYKKMFVIAAEGSVTEQEYFSIFDEDTVVHVRCLKGKSKTSPTQVLDRLKKFLREESLKPTDEAWIVVDKDQWSDADLKRLHSWSKTGKNFGFAVSNPKFEFWLVLHFSGASGITNSRHCDEKLRRALPNYDKHIEQRMFTGEKIRAAITRAKTLDHPRCSDWPRQIGTTVYRLVERIISI